MLGGGPLGLLLRGLESRMDNSGGCRVCALWGWMNQRGVLKLRDEVGRAVVHCTTQIVGTSVNLEGFIVHYS